MIICYNQRHGCRVPSDDCTASVMSPDGTLHPCLIACTPNANFPYDINRVIHENWR